MDLKSIRLFMAVHFPFGLQMFWALAWAVWSSMLTPSLSITSFLLCWISWVGVTYGCVCERQKRGKSKNHWLWSSLSAWTLVLSRRVDQAGLIRGCQGLVFHFAYNIRDKMSMSNNSRNLERGIKESDQQQLPIIVCKAQLQDKQNSSSPPLWTSPTSWWCYLCTVVSCLGASSKAATVRVSFH